MKKKKKKEKSRSCCQFPQITYFWFVLCDIVAALSVMACLV